MSARAFCIALGCVLAGATGAGEPTVELSEHELSIVLTLSRLVSRKGHDLVIRALPEILRAVPRALYVIAGPPNPPYEERLRSLARDLGVSDALLFLGYVASDEMADLYSAADVYVMTSRTQSGDDNFEGFGITYLEANACGVPVVGADSGGVADAIADGETGYLVPPDGFLQ